MNRQFVVGLGRLGNSIVGTLDIEVQVPKAWVDKSLSELDLSQKMGLTVLALKPKGGPGFLPHCDTVPRDGDVLVVGGTKRAMDSSPLVQPDGQ